MGGVVDYIFPRLYVGNQNKNKKKEKGIMKCDSAAFDSFKKKTKKKEDETSSCDSRHRQSIKITVRRKNLVTVIRRTRQKRLPLVRCLPLSVPPTYSVRKI